MKAYIEHVTERIRPDRKGLNQKQRNDTSGYQTRPATDEKKNEVPRDQEIQSSGQHIVSDPIRESKYLPYYRTDKKIYQYDFKKFHWS